jgi:hypothetical protein
MSSQSFSVKLFVLIISISYETTWAINKFKYLLLFLVVFKLKKKT